MRWSPLRPSVAVVPFVIVLAAMAIPPGQAADLSGVAFTELFTDPEDLVGCMDILAVAVGEPGDGTLAIRFTVADAGTCPPLSSVYFEFTGGDGTKYTPGFDDAFAPASYSGPAADACAAEGDVVICTVAYGTIGSAVGDTLTATYAVSYSASAQDYAPGLGHYMPQAFLGPHGLDYVLTGCTAAVCPEPSSAGAIVANLTTPALEVAFANATSGTYLYGFTLTSTAGLQLLHNITLANGTAILRAFDGAGVPVLNETLNASAAGASPLADTSPGNWSYELVLDGFQGAVRFEVAPVAPADAPTAIAPSSVRSKSGTSTASVNGTTSDGPAAEEQEEADAPAPGLTLLLGCLGVALLVRRRWR